MGSRLRTPLVATLALAVACCSPKATPLDFCSLVSDGQAMSGAYVRLQAIGLFSGHGAYLAHPDCPQLSAEWEERASFRSTPGWHELGEAISRVRSANIESRNLTPNDLAVDFSARVKWRRDRVALVVDRVYSTRPAPPVYRSEFDRVDAICELGKATGLEPDQTSVACERAAALRKHRMK